MSWSVLAVILESRRACGLGLHFPHLATHLCDGLFLRSEHPKVVQSPLGHSSITQTMDTYSHLMDGIGGDAVNGLDEAFG
jgi:integrase